MMKETYMLRTINTDKVESEDDSKKWKDMPCSQIGRINVVKYHTTQSKLQI